jgi:hypothetical protein
MEQRFENFHIRLLASISAHGKRRKDDLYRFCSKQELGNRRLHSQDEYSFQTNEVCIS